MKRIAVLYYTLFYEGSFPEPYMRSVMTTIMRSTCAIQECGGKSGSRGNLVTAWNMSVRFQTGTIGR